MCVCFGVAVYMCIVGVAYTYGVHIVLLVGLATLIFFIAILVKEILFMLCQSACYFPVF